MAEGNFGGGGSVLWTIKTDELRSLGDLSLKHDLDKGMFTEHGTDRSEGAAYGRNFVISFLPPRGLSPQEFIKNFSRYAQAKGERVEFKLVIEQSEAGATYKPQVQVGWGRFPGADQDPFRETAI
jgi:hypothetical protein